MLKEKYLKILNQGVEVWNKWKEENSEINPDFRNANLQYKNLSKVDLSWTNLQKANLTYTNFHKADFTNSDLREANLSGANLSQAILINADLRKATLYRTCLDNASLSHSKLNNATLEKAFGIGTHLSNANLYKAILRRTTFEWGTFYQTNLSEAKLNDAYLIGADLTEADLSGADLSNANLRSASLVSTNLERANLSGCSIFGLSAWKLITNEDTIQSNLLISDYGEPKIKVDNIEVAQFIHLLLNNEKVGDIIETIGKKGVLIIGRFTKESKAILHEIRDELRNKYDFLPILFEFDPISTEPTIKTLSTLAHLSRFVIADLTDAKSILQELTTILHELPTVPIQPILHQSAEIPPMVDGILVMQSVLDPYIYSSKEKLIADLPTLLVGPAQNWIRKFESKLAEVRQKWLPWQSK